MKEKLFYALMFCLVTIYSNAGGSWARGGWFRPKSNVLTSKGTKSETVIADYRKKDSVADSLLRKQLGLK